MDYKNQPIYSFDEDAPDGEIPVIIPRRHDHAFHVLGPSKLPLFVGSLIGFLSLMLVSKLQYTYDFSTLSITSILLAAFYPSYFISNTMIDSEISIKLLTTFLILLITICSWAKELVIEAEEGHHT